MKKIIGAAGAVLIMCLVKIGPAAAGEPLPAWLTPSEKAATKGPGDTYRLNHIDQYRITVAPPFTPIPVGEYDDAQGLLLGWTRDMDDNYLGQVAYHVYTDVKVYIMTTSNSDVIFIRSLLSGLGIPAAVLDDPMRFQFIVTDLDSIWMRDYGPVFVRDSLSNLAMIDHRYYFERWFDDKVPTVLQASIPVNLYRPSLNLEGGNFVSTTEGLCMTTYGAFWGNLPNDIAHVEQELHDYYGCRQVVFVYPLSGEGTTHIDMFLKFLDDTTVILAQDDPSADCLNADILELNAEILRDVVTPSGRPLSVHRIPMAYYGDGTWRTYTNSLIVNDKVLVPVYTDDTTHEAEALALYAALMPAHDIVAIDSTAVIPWGGAIHCVTMTMPDGNLTPAYPDPAAARCGDTWTCDPTTGCGSYTYEGVCDGNTAIWCDSGTSTVTWVQCDLDCAYAYPWEPCEEACGYDSSSGYYCTGTSRCTTCYDHCAPAGTACTADGSSAWLCGEAGDTDTCTERLYTDCGGDPCVDGTCGGCEPQCTGRECGPDSCGGTCGSCSAGYDCLDGLCVPLSEEEPDEQADIADQPPPETPVEPVEDAAAETFDDVSPDPASDLMPPIDASSDDAPIYHDDPPGPTDDGEGGCGCSIVL